MNGIGWYLGSMIDFDSRNQGSLFSVESSSNFIGGDRVKLGKEMHENLREGGNDSSEQALSRRSRQLSVPAEIGYQSTASPFPLVDSK